MKISLFSLIIFFLFSFSSSAQDSLPIGLNKKTKETLRVGIINLPPFFIFDSKNPQKVAGLAVEKIKSILENDFEIQWQHIPMGRGGYALQKGIIDIFTGYAASDSKRKGIDQSERPYYIIKPEICGRSLESYSDKTLKDLPLSFTKNKRLIFPVGSRVLPMITDKKINITRFEYSESYIQRSLRMIELNRADFFLIPTRTGFEKFNKVSCISLEGEMFTYLSFKKGSDLLPRVNKLMVSPESHSP